MIRTNRYFLPLAGMLVSIFLFIPAAVHAENIDFFHVFATIHADGAVSISEGITYNFGDLVKHGIFRTIPLRNENGPRIVITPASINDEQRLPYHYQDESTSQYTQWKIGDPNSTVTGIQTYLLNYDVLNVIRHFDDHDEWYWNVTGNEWEVPISVVDITIGLPEGAIQEQTQALCFTRPVGSTERECTVEPVQAGFHIYSTRLLAPGEGMTIAVSVPPGLITGTAIDFPEPPQKNRGLPFDFWRFEIFFNLLGIVIFVFIIFASIYSFLRRKTARIFIPKKLKNEPVVVSYQPPEGLTPPDIGMLIDRAMDPRDISPVIIDLAVKGYIKIVTKGKRSYEFKKLKSGADLVHPAYAKVYKMLFGTEDVQTPLSGKGKWWGFLVSVPVSRDVISLTQLSMESTRLLGFFKSIQKKMASYLKTQEYITIHTGVPYWRLGLSLIGVILCSVSVLFSSVPLLIAGMGIIFMLVYMRSPENLTEKGIDAFRKILGFKEYLGMVEADKLRLLNAPALRPEVFEKYLPYAMVFKLEKQWAQKFEGIPLVQPQWVEGSYVAGFSAATFADSLSSMNSSFSSAFASASSSSSGGGGSSGGGSGGGGGGSW